jgi:aryl-phospho-beta-D-glucosidase BglC (GH1 family)
MQRVYQSVAAPMFLTVVLLAAPGTPQRQDYYHGRGSQIVDSHGKAVRLSGISWWGLETASFAPLGLDKRPMNDIFDEIHTLGFNTVRIPFSNQMLHDNTMPKGINYAKNPELNGLNSLEVMDHMVSGAREHGMRVILDRHRPDAADQSELWYTPKHSEEEWISDWKMLAARYRTDDTVIGFDLHNEPHGKATWGTGDMATDWRLAAERAGNAVLSVNPNLLILVEGVETVNKDSYWWGGNLSAAGRFPVRLSRPAQLVYSAHDYPPSVGNQKWFQEVSYPNNLPEVWSRHWGYLAEENRVPVLLGEFGSHYSTADDKQWMAALVKYVSERNIGALYWSLNPESEDTGGILRDDWQTVDQVKLEALKPVLEGSSRTGVILASYTPPSQPPAVAPAPAAIEPAPIQVAAVTAPAPAQKSATAPIVEAAAAASAPVMEAASAASSAVAHAATMAMAAFSHAETVTMPVVQAATREIPTPQLKVKLAGKGHAGKEASARAGKSQVAEMRASKVVAVAPDAVSLSPLAQAQRMAAQSGPGKVMTASARRPKHTSSQGMVLDFEPKHPLGNASLD